MAEASKRQYAFQESSEGDELSSVSDERKRKIRKTIEVTRSTRYTEIVEREDGTNPGEQSEMAVSQNVFSSSTRGGGGETGDQVEQCSTSFALMDNCLGNMQEAIYDDKRAFSETCQEIVVPYLERLQKVETALDEKADMAEKCKRLEKKLINERETVRKNLLGVLEANRKNREKRDKMLTSLLENL